MRPFTFLTADNKTHFDTVRITVNSNIDFPGNLIQK